MQGDEVAKHGHGLRAIREDTMKLLSKVGVALLATTAILGVTALPANASESSNSSTYYVADCVRQVASLLASQPSSGASKEDCKVTTGISTGGTFTVTADQIAASPELTAAQKTQMARAAAAGAITGQHWSQFTTGAAYTRTQNGTFYYDGTYAWVTQPQNGFVGSQQCFTSYSVGFNLTGTSCSDSGTPTERYLYSGWDVNPNGTSIVYNVSMQATVYANGNISGFGATVG